MWARDRSLVMWWAERESNPHSRRRLIYSQRSSPPARSAQTSPCGDCLRIRDSHEGRNRPTLIPVDEERAVRIGVVVAGHLIWLSTAALRIIRGHREHWITTE